MLNEGGRLVSLIVPRSEAKERIERQVSKLTGILNDLRAAKNYPQFLWSYSQLIIWEDFTKELLRRLFSSDELAEEFASYEKPKFTTRMSLVQRLNKVLSVVKRDYIGLQSITERIGLYAESVVDAQPETREKAISIVDRLANRLHICVAQLAERQKGRSPFSVADEYDLQDLFYALLKIFFDDVRPEEYTPSYAGKSSKIDFVVKSHQVVVELKMARRGLGEKTIADQLIIDIDRYRKHPDCRTLVCIVYDPKRIIKNPTGLENDLSRKDKDTDVRVIVSPREG